MKAVAYRCAWDSSGWKQYHDQDDPLPDTWDSKPDEVAALVLKIEAEAEIQRLTAERDALRARIEGALSGVVLQAGDDENGLARAIVHCSREALSSGPNLIGKRVALVVIE